MHGFFLHNTSIRRSRHGPRKKSSSSRKTSKSASKDVESAMRRRKKGTLKSGSGKKVTSKKQAIAIGLSEGAEGGQEGRPEEILTGAERVCPTANERNLSLACTFYRQRSDNVVPVTKEYVGAVSGIILRRAT